MKEFSCQVRLAGDVNHVVPKYCVTEMEILLLRSLHGNDSVVRIKQTGEARRSEADEYKRLAGIYSGEKVEKLFMVKLDLNSIIEEDDEDDEPVITAATAKASAKADTKG